MPAPPTGTGEPRSTPLAVASSANADEATWQLAHDCVPEADSVVSAKIFWPSWAAADRVVASPPLAAGVDPPPPPKAASSSDAESASAHPLKPGIVIVVVVLRRARRPARIVSAIASDSQSEFEL